MNYLLSNKKKKYFYFFKLTLYWIRFLQKKKLFNQRSYYQLLNKYWTNYVIFFFCMNEIEANIDAKKYYKITIKKNIECPPPKQFKFFLRNKQRKKIKLYNNITSR